MRNISKSFQILWLVLTSAAWLTLFWLSTHKSDSTDVLGRYSWKYFLFLLIMLSFAVTISATRAHLYTYRWAFTLSLLSTILTFGLIETYFRVADPLGISYYTEATRYHLDKIADTDLVFRHRASWRAKYQGVEVRTNEFGLRDDPIKPKAERELRILALGDSITLGPGVAQDQIFTAKLQQILAAKLNRPVRVINAGVGGYNTVQEYAYLRKEGLSFKPNIILLTYHPNDVEVNSGPFDPWSDLSFTGKSPVQILVLLLGKSWTYRLITHVYRTNQSAPHDSVRQSQGWRDSMAALKHIGGISEEHGIRLFVLYFRWHVGSEGLLEDVRARLAPLPVQDVGEWFANTNVKQYWNSKVDSHPNTSAHRLLAEHVANYLLKQDLLSRH